eukprot:CAMPEP_0178990422 /NCGR_PEP_ID=MMETSP0795-20121207/4936_1 /TAXON_ID=88552 /ORGANISM="Amoebophrya sp., Strain Ameob2" /LENGTH=334 /DNA_ID=CAMNT_0020681963 /DNA_START=37 /DNA_END=1040 /DNA_ORIENTATION=+
MRAPTHVQLSVSSIRITSAAFQAQQGFLRRALSGNDESVCCVLFRDALDPGNHPPTAENTTGYVRLYPAGPGGGGVGAARGELQGDATAAPSVFDGRWELQGSGMLGGGTSPTTQQASTKNVRRVPRLDASQVVVGVMAASGGELIASTAVIPLADATMAFMLGRPLFLQDGTNVGELEFSLTLFPPLATLSSGGAGGLDFAGAGDLVQQLSDDPPTQHGQPRRLLDIQLNAADDGENDCPICDRGFVPCEYCDEFGYLVVQLLRRQGGFLLRPVPEQGLAAGGLHGADAAGGGFDFDFDRDWGGGAAAEDGGRAGVPVRSGVVRGVYRWDQMM